MMQHDEGGPVDAMVMRVFRHYESMIPDQVEYGIGIALAVLIVGFILWRVIPAGMDLHAIAETSTDRSLGD
ncbi:MAG: hypothetical protein Q8S35_00735 [bacterium]|nr:hypothetical protein [bacterium]